MKKLYMLSLGGKLIDGHGEIHDTQFVIAEDVVETYEVIKANWTANPVKMHLDSYKAIVGADGYKITIKDSVQDSELQLFFVFVGGYNPNSMLELHDGGLFVAKSLSEAKSRATKELLKGNNKVHADYGINISEVKLLNSIYSGYLHITESKESFDLIPDWFGYLRLDKLD